MSKNLYRIMEWLSMCVKVYDEYFDYALGFHDKLLTRAYEQLKESGKVKPRAYVLIPDISGFSKVIVTTIKGGKEFERKLSDDKITFDIYYIRNVRGFVCVEPVSYTHLTLPTN